MLALAALPVNIVEYLLAIDENIHVFQLEKRLAGRLAGLSAFGRGPEKYISRLFKKPAAKQISPFLAEGRDAIVAVG